MQLLERPVDRFAAGVRDDVQLHGCTPCSFPRPRAMEPCSSGRVSTSAPPSRRAAINLCVLELVPVVQSKGICSAFQCIAGLTARITVEKLESASARIALSWMCDRARNCSNGTLVSMAPMS